MWKLQQCVHGIELCVGWLAVRRVQILGSRDEQLRTNSPFADTTIAPAPPGKCNRVVYSGLCGRSCGAVSEHGRCWHGTADQRRIGVETAMKEMRDSCETTAVSRSRPVIALGPPLCSHRCFPDSSGGPRRIRGPGKIVQGPRAVDCSGYPHQWPPTVGIPPSGDRRIW